MIKFKKKLFTKSWKKGNGSPWQFDIRVRIA